MELAASQAGRPGTSFLPALVLVLLSVIVLIVRKRRNEDRMDRTLRERQIRSGRHGVTSAEVDEAKATHGQRFEELTRLFILYDPARVLQGPPVRLIEDADVILLVTDRWEQVLPHLSKGPLTVSMAKYRYEPLVCSLIQDLRSSTDIGPLASRINVEMLSLFGAGGYERCTPDERGLAHAVHLWRMRFLFR